MNEDRTDIPTTPVPPAPPAMPLARMLRPRPELHINIFGIIGQDTEAVKEAIADYREKFGDDFQCCFHVTLNPAGWRSNKRAVSNKK